jgi:hypothetical protein
MARPCSRANRTAACTSAVPRHWAMIAGRLSMRPLCTRRALSYVGSEAVITRPVNEDCKVEAAFWMSAMGRIIPTVSSVPSA